MGFFLFLGSGKNNLKITFVDLFNRKERFLAYENRHFR